MASNERGTEYEESQYKYKSEEDEEEKIYIYGMDKEPLEK